MLEFLLAVFFSSAHAQGTKTVPTECPRESAFKGTADPMLARLKGTVALFNPDCSGSLVTLEGRSRNAKALVVSAGHCIGQGKANVLNVLSAPDAGEVFLSIKQDRTFSLDTGVSAEPRACIASDQLIYATMTDTDVSIYQLTETYEEIERRTGVAPLTIAKESRFPNGTPIDSPSAFHQRNWTCETEGLAPKLKESGWSWSSALRFTAACEFIGGASGSPVVLRGTSTMIAVQGTVNFADRTPCEIMNPCEVDANGAVTPTRKGQSYGHLVHRIYSCLDASSNLDLNAPGCALPKP